MDGRVVDHECSQLYSRLREALPLLEEESRDLHRPHVALPQAGGDLELFFVLFG